MAKRRNVPKKERDKAESEAPHSNLLEALRFVSVAQADIGTPNQTHSIIAQRWIQAHDGVLTATFPIKEDLVASPSTGKLIDALSKCKAEFSITQLDSDRLAVKSDKFRAIIPSLDPSLLGFVAPDDIRAQISEPLRQALTLAGELASDKSDELLTASVLLKGQSILGTDRVMFFETWHGIDLPSGLVFSKKTIEALAKIPNKLTHFGFSDASATFYFDNGAWLKTALYAQPWPEIKDVFIECNAIPIPTDFFVGVNAVAPFSEDGFIHFGTECLQSHYDQSEGASYDVPGIVPGPAFSAKRLKLIEPIAKDADFYVDGGQSMIFHGDMVRGRLAGARVR